MPWIGVQCRVPAFLHLPVKFLLLFMRSWLVISLVCEARLVSKQGTVSSDIDHVCQMKGNPGTRGHLLIWRRSLDAGAGTLHGLQMTDSRGWVGIIKLAGGTEDKKTRIPPVL